VGLDDLVLEQVDRIVLLLKQRQFVLLTMGYVVDPKVAGTEIVPTPVGVESVELGSEVLQWVPVKLNVFWLGRAAAAGAGYAVGGEEGVVILLCFLY